MWTCTHCGCAGIAASLTSCPMCRKEREVPKTSMGGSTNAWADLEKKPSASAKEPVAPEPTQSGSAQPVSEPASPAPLSNPDPDADARRRIALARSMYDEKNYEEARRMLVEVRDLYPSYADEVATGLKSVEKAMKPQEVTGTGTLRLPAPGAGNG
jgi:hypothetical protein